MVRVWVGGRQNCVIPLLRVISECFREKRLIIKRYVNSSVLCSVDYIGWSSAENFSDSFLENSN